MKKLFSFALVASLVSLTSPAWSQCVGCASSAPVFNQGYSQAAPVQYGQVIGGRLQAMRPVQQVTYTSGQFQTYTSDCGVGCGQVSTQQVVSQVGCQTGCGNVIHNNCCTPARRSGLLSNRGRFVSNRACGTYCAQPVCNTGCGQVAYHSGVVMGGCGTGCGQVVYASGCGNGCGGVMVSEGETQNGYDIVSPPGDETPTPAIPTPDVSSDET